MTFYKSKTYAVPESRKVACLVTGYYEPISAYRVAVRQLNERGFTVVVYMLYPKVIRSGNPQTLLDAIQALIADFSAHAQNADEVMCAGASMGAGIALSVQQALPTVRYGIYAVAGVSPSASIFDMPLFYAARKKFMQAGYDAAALMQIWQQHEIMPELPPRTDSPIVMTLSTQDRIVDYSKAIATLKAWQNAGVPVHVITRPRYGHLMTIRWFKHHIAELLDIAEAERSKRLVKPAD